MPSRMTSKHKLGICKIYYVNLFLSHLKVYNNLTCTFVIVSPKTSIYQDEDMDIFLQNALPTFLRAVSCTYMYEGYMMINIMNRKEPKQNPFPYLLQIT